MYVLWDKSGLGYAHPRILTLRYTHLCGVCVACEGACACSAMSLGRSKSDPTSAYVAHEVGLSVGDAESCVHLVHLRLLVGHTVMLCFDLGIYPIVTVSAFVLGGFLRLFIGAGSSYSRMDDPGMCDPNSCACRGL